MTPNDGTRDDLLAALARLGRLRPEWRLGQTLANLAMTAGRMTAGGVWDMEDGEALAAARELIGQYEDRVAEPAGTKASATAVAEPAAA